MFAHSASRTIEWGDCDPAGIVFYPRFFAMFDAATAAMIEAATGLTRAAIIARYRVVSWPIVDTRAIFRASVAFDDRVRIDSRVARLGNASFDVEHRLWRDDVLCIEASETRVWAARAENDIKALPIPDEIRRALAATGSKEDKDDGAL